MDETTRKMIQAAMDQTDPKLVEKFGNPLDEDDPRNWPPSKRAEMGISEAEQLRLLGLDVEGHQRVIAMLSRQLFQVMDWMAEQMKKEFIELMKTDPQKAADQLVQMMKGSLPTSYGPLDDSPDTPVRYAGSIKGAAPDQLIDTPNGPIPAREVPGYKEDPEWLPSPDWIDANCTCPVHVAARNASENHRPDDFGYGDGLYL